MTDYPSDIPQVIQPPSLSNLSGPEKFARIYSPAYAQQHDEQMNVEFQQRLKALQLGVDVQKMRDARESTALELLQHAAKSPSRALRALAIPQLAAQVAKNTGQQVPLALQQLHIDEPLSKEEMVSLDLDIGSKMYTPQQLKDKYYIDDQQLLAFTQSRQNPDYRKVMGYDSLAEQELKQIQVRKERLDVIQTQMKINEPNVSQLALDFHWKLFGEPPTTAKPHQIAKAVEEALAFKLEEAERQAGIGGLPFESASKIASQEQALDRLGEGAALIENPAVFERISTLIGPPLTGPGALRVAKEKLPTRLFGELPTEFVALQSWIGTYANLLGNARSGGAIPPEEYERLVREIPSLQEDKPNAFRTKMRIALENARSVTTRMKEMAALEGKGKVVPRDRAGVIAKHPTKAVAQQARAGERWVSRRGPSGEIEYGKIPVGAPVPRGWTEH